MSTTLATTSTKHPPTRALTGEHWGRVNDKVRCKVRLLKGAMQALCNAPARGLTLAYAQQAEALTKAGLKLSPDRVKKYFQAWRSDGEDGGDYALVDHRLCKGCGLPGCTSAQNRSLLHQITVDHWVHLATENKALSRRGTMVFRDAWKRLLNALIQGDTLPGVANGLPGTWRSLFQLTNPTAPTPEKCPWNAIKIPPGWSYQNFMERKPDKAVLKAAQEGVAAALKTLPQVRIDYSALRPMEAVMIDDHRLDVMVWGEWAGKVQLVELWALFIMDLATRRILWVQLHPRYQDEAGNTVGIRARDVQHAFAHMFRVYGIPLHYRCEIVCENATAVITASCAEIIQRAFEGRVTVRWSGTFDKKLFLAGFSERGGSPNGKAALESFFGRRFDVAFGSVKGQIGSRYDLQPGQLERSLQQANRVINRVGNLATDDELQNLIVGFHDIASVRPLILDALHRIETNERHELQGFEKVMEWRLHEEDKWRPMTDPALSRMLRTHGQAYVNEFLALPGMSQGRMETVRERWQRLFHPDDFAIPSPEALFEMVVDEVPATYRGGNVLTVNFGRRGGGVHEFTGSRHHLAPDSKIIVRLDMDNPQEGCWLYLPDGRFVGVMDYRARTAYGDEEGLKDQLKIKAQAEANLLRQVRQIKEPRAKLMQALEAQTARLDTLQMLDARASQVMPASDGNVRFVEALTDDQTAHDLPDEEDLAPKKKRRSVSDLYMSLNR